MDSNGTHFTIVMDHRCLNTISIWIAWTFRMLLGNVKVGARQISLTCCQDKRPIHCSSQVAPMMQNAMASSKLVYIMTGVKRTAKKELGDKQRTVQEQ